MRTIGFIALLILAFWAGSFYKHALVVKHLRGYLTECYRKCPEAAK